MLFGGKQKERDQPTDPRKSDKLHSLSRAVTSGVPREASFGHFFFGLLGVWVTTPKAIFIADHCEPYFCSVLVRWVHVSKKPMRHEVFFRRKED